MARVLVEIDEDLVRRAAGRLGGSPEQAVHAVLRAYLDGVTGHGAAQSELDDGSALNLAHRELHASRR